MESVNVIGDEMMILDSSSSYGKVDDTMMVNGKGMVKTSQVMEWMVALYVGDLHPDVTSKDLYDFFYDMEGLISARVCRDRFISQSLCYGYVNFQNTQQASEAILKKNHKSLKGKSMRVMFSCQDADARKSGIGNLFVKNLVQTIDDGRLQEMFQSFGTILSSKVSKNQDGKSKGFGFVQFSSQDSANLAIEKLDGVDIGGKKIYVASFVRKSERLASIPDSMYTNLYIKNLDGDITEDVLRLKFSEFGNITSMALAKDGDGNPKGFAFVNFQNHESAKLALEKMHGIQLGSKSLYVARAQKKEERMQTLHKLYQERRNAYLKKSMDCNVYAKNIDEDVDDSDLQEYFGVHGRITCAKIMRNDKGMSRGFGFVCYSTAEEASHAVKSLHGRMFHGKPLYVAIAQRKEDRKAILQQKFAQHTQGLGRPSSAFIPHAYPFYFPSPNTMDHIPPTPPQGFIYPSLGMRPTLGPNVFIPPAMPPFQSISIPAISGPPSHYRQNRGRFGRQIYPQEGNMMQFLPDYRQSNRTNSSKYSNRRWRAGRTKNGSNRLSQNTSTDGRIPAV